MKTNLLSKMCLAVLTMTISAAANNQKSGEIGSVNQTGNFQWRRQEFLYPFAKEISKTKDGNIFSSSLLKYKISSGETATCQVPLNNMTQWNIKIYIDAYYRGTVGAYDDVTIYYERAGMKIYLRADFSNGTYKYWGPTTLTCQERQNVFGIVD